MSPCYVLQQQMTWFARLPKDTALTEDRRIPRTGSKCETMIGHSPNPLSQDAQRQLAARPLSHLRCSFQQLGFFRGQGKRKWDQAGSPDFLREDGIITRFHFRFLRWVSGQQNPYPDPDSTTFGYPPYPSTKKSKQSICS